MTELVEGIAIGVFEDKPVECPLDHDVVKITATNDFKGDGGTLGEKMTGGVSTILYEPNKKGKPPKDPYPSLTGVEDWPIEVEDHDYPVTCAAHHLIPAQAALKKAKTLHQWMVYQGESEPVGGKGGGPATGLVWADVGYDVNGVENGVWLPGNYAVGGGTGGTGDWTSAASAYPDDEQKSAPKPPPRPSKKSRKLTGLRHTFEDDDNRKSEYVLQATKLYRAQFHDSHSDYSRIVTDILQKLGSLYEERQTEWRSNCPKCKERFKKIKDEGIPTHFALAHRLNSVSTKMKGYLVGRRGDSVVYTSTWGRAAADHGVATLPRKRKR